jgi:phenylalanyl-tRNA synthetase beta chain
MRFSYNWLRDLVAGLSLDANSLARQITMKTAECDGVYPVGVLLAQASAAMIVEAFSIPGSHNRRAVVDTERYGRRVVVCGAENCRAGVRTLYLPAGKKQIDNIESDGMLGSARELGVSDDHSGIAELWEGEGSLEPDWIIEIDNKSLTNRPDLWGHVGMAREVAAICGLKMSSPPRVDLSQFSAEQLVGSIDASGCFRYSAALVKNVHVVPSPLWLQYRLHSLGVSTINNVVDITNYVMCEIGQPMHAFDADLLRGEIQVRRARSGECLRALNGEDYSLGDDDFVIADGERAVALAGIIGGSETAITLQTRRVLFESACFLASSVRKTASRLRIRTEASMRFEKAQDPENTVVGLNRASSLLNSLDHGAELTAYSDKYVKELTCPKITFDLQWAAMKLGKEVSRDQVVHIFRALGFEVTDKGGTTLIVDVPSWRATKDISVPEDLVEEIGRIVGYASIDPVAPLIPSAPVTRNRDHDLQRDIRAAFAGQGFTEVSNYSFIGSAALAAFGFDSGEILEVVNPIDSGQGHLRPSLIPGIWANIIDNSRFFTSFRLFEIGKQYRRVQRTDVKEELQIAAAIYDLEGDGVAGISELKRVATYIVPQMEVIPVDMPRPYEHPERAGLLICSGSEVGRLFELRPALVERGHAVLLEVGMDALKAVLPDAKMYSPLRRFPTSNFDLSIVAPDRQPVGTLAKQLYALGSAELVSLEFLGIYALPSNEKSVSFRLTLGAVDHTLATEEVNSARERIISGLQAAGYELRG